MFCQRCGQEMPDTSRFCASCGKDNQPPQPQVYVHNEQLSQREVISAILWLVTAAFQVMYGWTHNFWMVAVSGISFKMADCRFNQSARVSVPYPDLVAEYRSRLGWTLMLLLVNVTLGGYVGVIAGIYDLVTRHGVLKKATLFYEDYQNFIK